MPTLDTALYTLDPHGRVCCRDCGASEFEGVVRHAGACDHSAKARVSVREISLRAQSGARDAGWLRAAAWTLGQMPEGEERTALAAQVAAEEPKISAAASAPKLPGKIMMAKFASRCGACGRSIEAGDEIHYFDKRATHLACAQAAPPPAVAHRDEDEADHAASAAALARGERA